MCAGSDSSSFFSLNDSFPALGARTRFGSFGAAGTVVTAAGLPGFGFAGAAFIGAGVARFRDEGPLATAGFESCGAAGVESRVPDSESPAFAPDVDVRSFGAAGP